VSVDFENDLNPEQLAAVTHGDGPQLVLAGAGSGKTRVITHRIAWLVKERGVDPSRIVAVTFTNRAAGEMRERVERILDAYPLTAFVGTFHRYCLRLLRRWGERVGLKQDLVVLDTADQLAFVKQALEAEGLSDKAYAPRSVLASISSAKNRLLDADGFEAEAETFFQRKVAPVFRRYQGLLRQSNGVDFDDIIALAVRLLGDERGVGERVRRRIEHLLVDEFQDTNQAQLRLIRELMEGNDRLTAVGDEDQGIYRWRGADLDNVLRFEEFFPDAVVRKLERNYRSTQNILDASGNLVANNQHRRGKRLWTDAGPGADLELYRAGDEGDEANWMAKTLGGLRQNHRLSEMAVLVRTNAQSRALEEALLRHQVPYVLVGGVRFYERAEIKDLIAYLRALRNPRDTYSLLRILNQPPRGIGAATQEMLRQRAAELQQPLWDVIYQDELGGLPARSHRAVRAFRDLLVDLREAAAELSPVALLDRLLETTGYAELFRPEDPEQQARLENVREFLSAAQEFSESHVELGQAPELLTGFLDHVSLLTDIDTWQAEGGISLMTLHSAKGLEFSVVVVAGLEEGLLPHFNAQGRPEDLEEERRLLYVGMTRARERLFLSTCRRRRIAGRYQDQSESPFLGEIPEHLMRISESPSLFRDQRSRAVAAFFGRGGGKDLGGESGAGGQLGRGSRVRHPTLGQGVVVSLEGDGPDMKLTVLFDREGPRKLVAKYANLELL
jgi:DNA helicase-2/ATP-dependent DNA helicase PcrA